MFSVDLHNTSTAHGMVVFTVAERMPHLLRIPIRKIDIEFVYNGCLDLFTEHTFLVVICSEDRTKNSTLFTKSRTGSEVTLFEK